MVKIAQKTTIFANKSPKNDQIQKFFLKQKMLRICDFHNKFSISGPFDVSEWVPDGPESHGAQDGLKGKRQHSTSAN